jgi:putative hemolysin
MRNRFGSIVLVCAMAVGVAACASVNAAGEPSPSTSAAPVASGNSDQDARDYCLAQGGQLVDRVATSNTNGDPAAQLPLAGRMTFCEFEEGTGDATTRISVDLTTLSSTSPTLAAIAYLSKLPPVLPPQPSANPADYNCTNGLGGTVSWGNDNVSGGWVDASQPVFTVMDECVFPDFSAIDAFGIFYYANGTVRGADLATKMRYRPDQRGLPQIFEPKTGGNRP